MDFAGAGVALVMGADKMILAVVLGAFAGAEVQLGPAVSAVEQAGKHAGPACFCRPAFVLPQLLYPFPLSFLNDSGLEMCIRDSSWGTVLKISFPFLAQTQRLDFGIKTSIIYIYPQEYRSCLLYTSRCV